MQLLDDYLKRSVIRFLELYNRGRVKPTNINIFLEKVLVWIEYKFWSNFSKPKTWTEFIIQKKFFGNCEKLAQISDKVAVREFVKEKIGPDYLCELYDVVGNKDEINEERYHGYPQNFVIKPNMASKRVYINKGKNYKKFRDAIHGFMYEFGNRNNEFHYKWISPKLVIEEWLYSEITPLQEYKCWVFHGRVELISHSFNIYESERSNNYRYRLYDRNWNEPRVQFRKNLGLVCASPDTLPEIICVAEELAAGWDYLRVDLYDIGGKIKFGECTPTPSAGRSFFFNMADQKWVYQLCQNQSNTI